MIKIMKDIVIFEYFTI